MANRHPSDSDTNATPTSFGKRPAGYRLPDATRLGHVKLQVANIDRSVEWYDRVLGLKAIRSATGEVSLTAADGTRLVELVEYRNARPGGTDRRLGLFHYAILLPNRPSLAAFAQHIGEIGEQVGASDHLVSEAFYISDPDGLGIEVYADRPRASWKVVDGQLAMATDPIDIRGLLADLKDPWTGMPAGTTMGHMHLHVGDLGKAADFFSEALGLDRVVERYPGALFMSAGGYHHHLGTNTWAGPSAREPRDDDARLLEWNVILPTSADVAAAAASLERGGAAVVREGVALTTRDPWGTGFRISGS
jgi:catechol 2,3-dioxygenase